MKAKTTTRLIAWGLAAVALVSALLVLRSQFAEAVVATQGSGGNPTVGVLLLVLAVVMAVGAIIAIGCFFAAIAATFSRK